MTEEKEYIFVIVERLAKEYEISERTIYRYIDILTDFFNVDCADENFGECLEMIVSERSSIYHNNGVDAPYSLEETIFRAYQEVYGEELETSDSMKDTLTIEKFEKEHDMITARSV